MIEGIARAEFYILCQDNETTRQLDGERIDWAVGDIIENRPALSRWHPDWADASGASWKAERHPQFGSANRVEFFQYRRFGNQRPDPGTRSIGAPSPLSLPGSPSQPASLPTVPVRRFRAQYAEPAGSHSSVQTSARGMIESPSSRSCPAAHLRSQAPRAICWNRRRRNSAWQASRIEQRSGQWLVDHRGTFCGTVAQKSGSWL